MVIKAGSPEEYLDKLPPAHKEAITKLRNVVKKNIPRGFQENISYNMIGYCVPHSIYPKGYHCNPKDPLPFACIASQKNHIALYHMGVYSKPEILKWFTTEYPKHSPTKLDMGKSCIRWKNPEHIPYKLIGELMKKITVEEWVEHMDKYAKK